MKSHPCRQTIRDLADWADLPAEAALSDPHLRSCAGCARRVERARRSAELLRRCAEPARRCAAESVPNAEERPQGASMVGETFLPALQATICEETAVGNLLRAALPPLRMPFDVPVASELASGASARRVGALLGRGLPPRSTPAWMWNRVRADLRSWLAAERSLRRRRVARWVAGALMTAAAVLIAVKIGVKLSPPTELRAAQIIDAPEPYDPSLLPASIMEAAARPVESVERK